MAIAVPDASAACGATPGLPDAACAASLFLLAKGYVLAAVQVVLAFDPGHATLAGLGRLADALLLLAGLYAAGLAVVGLVAGMLTPLAVESLASFGLFTRHIGVRRHDWAHRPRRI